MGEIGIDDRVVAFCALASITTVLIFGLLPAWQVSRSTVAEFLKAGGRGGTGSAAQHRLQSGLVILQVAMALVLLTRAGLMVESFEHFERQDPGFRPAGVLSAEIGTLDSIPAHQSALALSVVRRLEALPGVTAASASWTVLGGSLRTRNPFTIAGDPAPDPGRMPVAWFMGVTPDYFRTMGIKLLRGREILPTDDSRAVKVAVVDKLLAQSYFGSEDPIGRQLVLGNGEFTLNIVGVVATVRQQGLTVGEMPELYLSFAQFPFDPAFVEVRTSTNPQSLTPALREAIATVDPTVPVWDIKTMDQRATQSVGTMRFSSFLASLFAAVALLLGMVGIYSVLAFLVTQRQREIGVRLALGATHSRVMGSVLRHALVLAGTGIVLGSGASWALTRILVGLFGNGSAYDPGFTVQGWHIVPTFVGAATAFAGVALIAGSIPAFHATRVSPVVALTSA